MAYLLTRIRDTFKQVKQFARKDAIISKFKTSRVGVYQLVVLASGVGIYALIIVAGTTYLIKEDNIEVQNYIVDLDKIVLETMRKKYLAETGRLRSFFNYKNDLKLDWSDVYVYSQTPEYSKYPFDRSTGDHIKQMINNVTRNLQDRRKTTERFANYSCLEQTRKIRTELQSTSSYQTTLTEGYTCSLNKKVSFSAPQDISKATNDFSEGLTLQDEVENSDKKRITRFTEDTITIPSNSEIEIQTDTTQTWEQYYFRTSVYMKGSVKGTFSNKKNPLVRTIILPIEEINSAKFSPDSFSKNTGRHFKYQGRCEFTYGIQQATVITEKKLSS